MWRPGMGKTKVKPIIYMNMHYSKWGVKLLKVKAPFYDYVRFGYLHDMEYKNPN